MKENVIIPFYLNEKVINSLYSVVIQKYVKIKSINKRKQCIVNLNTPLSNISPGHYLQGDLSVQVLDECSRERIDERVSMVIEIFMNIMDILQEKGVLKYINSREEISKIEKNDFIVFSSKISEFPTLSRINDIVSAMQYQEVLGLNKNENDKETTSSELLYSMKNYIEEYKKTKCVKYISDDIFGSSNRIILPLKMEYLQGDIDYLMNNEVSIFAKVINTYEDNYDKDFALKSGTCFDFMDSNSFSSLEKKVPLALNKNRMAKSEYIDNYDFIETIPIAIYM
ncbi:hypothetical protein ACER0A_006375 [Haloimpatiens sp. FM7315]|uniref:DUF6414 family protein n=1 Tax=Haloimpatiens sp. FM7315 TaxID=3298609 RepID=UPI0035A32701